MNIWKMIYANLKKKGSIVLIGDTNSRIGTFNDFILNDDDKHSPVPDAYVSDENENLLNRHNEDISSVNTYGRRLLDLCKDHEMRILNGRTIGDLSGKLTCYKWNGSSTVDYGIVQRNIFNNVDFFKVHNLEGPIVQYHWV